MRLLPAAIVFLLPLAIAPGWLFYYDVTPKAVLLLAGLAALALLTACKPEPVLSFVTSRHGRWNTLLAAATAVVIGISAVRSPYPSLAWTGSTWRASGALLEIATLAAATLAAAFTSRGPGSRTALLKALSAAGLLAGAYGILEYFGWDPWLDAAAYHFGQGPYEIVRPPATMGHSNYLAAFLLWPAFTAAGLYRADRSPLVRAFAAASAAVSAIALVLCGSRGALLGLAAGALVFLPLARPRLRSLTAAAALCAVVLGVFYFSPAGARLRARVFWAGEDSAGGARLLLWRDALRMSTHRPWTGFGPDTFVAAFPGYQSADLSRAYPDFYHESPHNMFLDALLDEGFPGAALLAVWLALGLIAARRTLGTPDRPIATALLAALVAATVAHQFIVFVIPTAFLFFLTVASLCGADRQPAANSAPAVLRRTARPLCATAAVILVFPVVNLLTRGHTAARIQNLLDADRPAAAADLWPSSSTSPADLAFSRRFAEASARAADATSKLRYAQLAGLAAARATRNPEQRQNAFYNLATIEAAAGDLATTEAALRRAIAAAPTWYKPHWALARLLHLSARPTEAAREAQTALDLNGAHDPEVAATLDAILRSAPPAP